MLHGCHVVAMSRLRVHHVSTPAARWPTTTASATEAQHPESHSHGDAAVAVPLALALDGIAGTIRRATVDDQASSPFGDERTPDAGCGAAARGAFATRRVHLRSATEADDAIDESRAEW